MERRAVIFDIEGQQLELTPENCGIAFFRDLPEADYIDIWTGAVDDEQQHHWIFNNREKLIWMGAVCVQDGDERILHLANREHGSFKEQTGWNPSVLIEDMPRPYELELYAEQQTGRIEQEWEQFND
jgi:hypothetical protein